MTDKEQTIQALRATISERDEQINLLQTEIHNLSLGQRELLRQVEGLRAELREAQRYAKLVTERAEGGGGIVTIHKTPTPQNNLPDLLPAPVALVKRNDKSSTGLPFTPEKTLQHASERLPDNSTLHPLTLPVPGERNAAFKSACLLTHQITVNLGTERRHYWTKAGKLLTTLDEIIRAILTNDLLELQPNSRPT